MSQGPGRSDAADQLGLLNNNVAAIDSIGGP